VVRVAVLRCSDRAVAGTDNGDGVPRNRARAGSGGGDALRRIAASVQAREGVKGTGCEEWPPVAVTLKGRSPKVLSGMAAKVMVWLALATSKERLTGVAGL